MQDSYRHAGASVRAEINVRGSRFVADVVPVADEGAASAALARIRRDEHAATHHCWAYRLGPRGETVRYSDDGEPSGTAGLPILRRLEASDLTQTLAVVTRYYGGTKLGTGGLVRAYGEAVNEALRMTPIRQHVVRIPLRLRFAYDDTSPAMRLVERYRATILDTDYGEDTRLTIGVKPSEVETFAEAFAAALAGRGSVRGPDPERG